MATKIKIRTVWGMNETDYKQCLALNLRGQGSMMGALKAIRDHPERVTYAYAYMLKDVDTDELLSWSLLFQRGVKARSYAYYYTRKSKRGKDYGTRIVRAQRKHKMTKRPVVYPWSDESRGFFNKTGLIT